MTEQRQLVREIESRERLVGEDPTRLAREHAREQRPGPFSTRQRRDAPRGERAEIERRQHRGDFRLSRIAVREAAERDQRGDGQVPGNLALLRQVADRPRPRRTLHLGKGASVEQDLSRCRLQQPRQALQQARLAGAIRAADRRHGTGREFGRDALQPPG